MVGPGLRAVKARRPGVAESRAGSAATTVAAVAPGVARRATRAASSRRWIAPVRLPTLPSPMPFRPTTARSPGAARLGVVALGVALALALVVAWQTPAPASPTESSTGSVGVDPGPRDAAVADAPAVRMAVPSPSADHASLTAHLRLPADWQAGSLFCLWDGRPHLLATAVGEPVTLQIERIAPGAHRLVVGWLTTAPRVQVIDRAIAVQPRESLDLGWLELAPRPTGWLRVVCTGADGAVLDAAAMRAAGYDTMLARLQIQAANPVPVPQGVLVPIDGLEPEGLSAMASVDEGKSFRSATTLLLPGRTAEFALGQIARAALTVTVWWSGAPGWIELNAVQSADRVVWARKEGSGKVTMELEVDSGPALVVASLVDRGGTTHAFALRDLDLDPTGRLELSLQSTVPVRGHGDPAAAGQRVGIALGAWPQRDLWRAVVGADGTFSVPGLPLATPLLVHVGDETPRRATIERLEPDWHLVVAPR